MLKNSLFHLDCNPIIPACGYQCGKCIQEIQSVLKIKSGILEVSLKKHKGISVIAIRHNPYIIGIKDLQNELGNLPSFYSGFFIPRLVEI